MTSYKNGYTKNGIIALCSIVYFVSYFSRKDFAAVMAGMISSDAIGRENAGLAGAMLFAFYGVGQLLSGYLGDKIKPKHLIVIGLSTTALCNGLMPLIPEGAMIAVWGLNGLTQAMLWPPIVKILSTYLDHETFVTANLVVTSAAHLATVLLYVFTPLCLVYMSWQTVFYTSSILALISCVLFAVTLNRILPKETNVSAMVADDNTPGAQSLKDTVAGEGIMSVLSRSGIFTVFICIIVCGFMRDGIESWLPTLYCEAFGSDVAESTLLSIILPIFSVISIFIVTVLHKRRTFNNEILGSAILFFSAIVSAALLTVFISLKGSVFGIISLILAAYICAAMHGVNFLLISCLPGRFARFHRAATVSGICNSFVYVGAAASTYGIAYISDKLGWGVTVISWCAILAIGIIFALISRRRYTHFISSD
jgi:OPA family glycerol-3-phosphate transporter-like MFS transporter